MNCNSELLHTVFRRLYWFSWGQSLTKCWPDFNVMGQGGSIRVGQATPGRGLTIHSIHSSSSLKLVSPVKCHFEQYIKMSTFILIATFFTFVVKITCQCCTSIAERSINMNSQNDLNWPFSFPSAQRELLQEQNKEKYLRTTFSHHAPNPAYRPSKDHVRLTHV